MYIKTRDGKTSTLRALFQRMAPLAHHFDPQQSLVLAHIAEVLGCDLGEAQRCFNSMRQGKVGVLRFNRAQAAWHGCEWVSDDEEESKLEVARHLGVIDKRLMKLEAAQRRMPKGGGRAAKEGDADQSNTELADAVKVIEDKLEDILIRLDHLEHCRSAPNPEEIMRVGVVEQEDALTAMRRRMEEQDRIAEKGS